MNLSSTRQGLLTTITRVCKKSMCIVGDMSPAGFYGAPLVNSMGTFLELKHDLPYSVYLREC